MAFGRTQRRIRRPHLKSFSNQANRNTGEELVDSLKIILLQIRELFQDFFLRHP